MTSRSGYVARQLLPSTSERLLLYHVTTYDKVARIATLGLRPRTGRGVFGHSLYGSWSYGKVFVCENQTAAREWFSLIGEMLIHDYSDDSEPDRLVPVMLRIDRPPRGRSLDKLGTEDVDAGRSFYFTRTIEPDRLSFWDPRTRRWRKLQAWLEDPPPAMLGVSLVEHYDEDGQLVDEHDRWVARGFYAYGAYERGGFKP